MVANNVRYWRTKLGIRQLELSTMTGVSTATIVATERYGYVPCGEVRQRLSKGLGIAENLLWPDLVSNANIKIKVN